ncbi:MAG: methyl-accepting chemotaxis protein [Treponema sp.]|nr:methyl-accepting chemotaxis protein [Treponema sp.]
MCNNASKAGAVTFNGDMCIGCGECLTVCDPKARYGLDDFDLFMNDLKAGISIVAIVPPAIAASFDGQYLRFNGFLKKLGVKAVFDVSFGAELTIKSYLAYRKRKKPKVIIAQPCPTLVAYVEMYQPDLIPYLAPVDSPMLHTIKMIKQFYPQYATYKIAAISPCLSKRREFEETGRGDYNVTFKSIQKYLDRTGSKISGFQAEEYDGPSAERAVLFSSPGGLMRTIRRYEAGVSAYTKQVEGAPGVYRYLEYLKTKLENGQKPLYPLIDCLACEMGCNGGPGTVNHDAQQDDLLEQVEKRRKAAVEKHRKAGFPLLKFFMKSKLEKTIDRHWEESLYTRAYVNRSGIVNRVLREPTPNEIRDTHLIMHKRNPEDFLNCHACGYESCDQMVIACLNGLNNYGNCRHYVETQGKMMEAKHKEELVSLLARVHRITQEEVHKNIHGITSLSERIDNSTSSVMNSYRATDEIVKGVYSIQAALEQSSKAVDQLNYSSAEGKKRLMQIDGLIANISTQSEALVDVAKVISNVADETNILGMNAAIQAAHAGDSVGKGFAVVAGQIRHLASNSSRQAGEIAKRLKDIKSLIDDTHASSSGALEQFDQIVTLASEVQRSGSSVKKTVEFQNQSGRSAMEELNRLKESSMKIQEESDALMSSSKNVLKNIDAIKKI